MDNELLEKKRLKAIYDSEYRKKNKEKLKIKKAEYFKKDYALNPEKHKEWRVKKKSSHAEYIRQERYKEWKKEYDKKYLAKKNYG